jgi:replication factor C subunit 1
MDLYYQDFSFVPLFMQVDISLGHHLESTVKALIGFLAHLQENYIKQNPSRVGIPPNSSGTPDQQLRALDLISKAADSISDGDLVDRLIHR